ncbi:hypothetical protein Scep_001936 [Stephania cephalantha]|uniref:Uncharacterized protein n=1 Tax=Stephania cephalantha TaxID=152367 RepID=A0AAP0LA32_9MAGN
MSKALGGCTTMFCLISTLPYGLCEYKHCHTPDVRRVQLESCNCCDLIQSSFDEATC